VTAPQPRRRGALRGRPTERASGGTLEASLAPPRYHRSRRDLRHGRESLFRGFGARMRAVACPAPRRRARARPCAARIRPGAGVVRAARNSKVEHLAGGGARTPRNPGREPGDLGLEGPSGAGRRVARAGRRVDLRRGPDRGPRPRADGASHELEVLDAHRGGRGRPGERARLRAPRRARRARRLDHRGRRPGDATAARGRTARSRTRSTSCAGRTRRPAG
jgi:hypothetical protein